jgi:transposase
MLQPTVRRTWAPSGQTPLLVPSAKHDRWSIITALTVSPDRQRLGLYFQGFAENITGEHCELFVWAIHQQVRRPLLVVWDGLSAHATAANALQDRGDRILFERLPAYSPQLNPVEFVWSHTKHGKMANFCPLDFAQLGDRVSDTLLETRREQRLLRSFFDHAALTLEFSPLDS